MIVLVVLLWACGIAAGSCAIPGEPWLPTLRERLERQQRAVEEDTSPDAERKRYIKRWLELRMAKETAERIEQVQRVIDEQPPQTDAERQEFLRRWLALKMATEGRAMRRNDRREYYVVFR
jgi:hypothetical protein